MSRHGAMWKQGSLPNLYLVGAPKAGTTSIAGWLAEHPDVYWSVPKEPYFWASDFPGMRSHYGFDTEASYRQLYSSPEAHAARVRADGSTTYLYSSVAVPHILGAVPDARFVVCVREPARLLTSYHRTQLVTLNETERNFDRAWQRSLTGSIGSNCPLDQVLLDYPRIGALGSHLNKLLQLVPAQRVHVVVLDDLVSDSRSVWQRLAAFLELDPRAEPSFNQKNRSDKTPRWNTVRRLTHRPPTLLQQPMQRLRHWSRTTSTPGITAFKRQMWKPEPRPSLPTSTAIAIREYFAADVDLLSTLIQRDLSSWTTDRKDRLGLKEVSTDEVPDMAW